MRVHLVVAVMAALVGCQSPPPPVMATIPVYTLTAPSGEPFKSTSLAGQPYVASFFFTSCATICPRVMGGVRGALTEASRRDVPLRAVSVTVDPVTDTPERLQQYAAKEGISGERWTLLTGSEAELDAVVKGAFMAYIGEREALEGDLFEIGHEGRLMLIDSLGRLRGIFEPDADGQRRLVEAAGRI